MNDDRKKALSTTLGQIEKQFGKGSVMRMGDVQIVDVETVSTGSLGLDVALGVGGLPMGRVVEIYGPEASGKTTLTLQVVAEIQKKGGVAAFVDAEHALDRQYAEKIGVKINELLLAQPNNGEEALEITDMLVRSGAVDLVVIDSVAALTPKAEIEGEMGDSHMGLQARLMSQALRKLTANIKRFNTLVIFINQIRMKIGVMFGCFDYDTPIVLADGRREKIGKIVSQKLPVEVLSYNPQTATFEAKKVVKWFDNGETDEFLQFEVATAGQENGRHQFACTPNHLLLTPHGYRPAGEMKIGDPLMTQNVSQAVPMPIVNICRKSPSYPTHRFDLKIEDHHNYLVDGVIVHNSPETTTGGNALKFYASVRLDIRRIGSIKRGDEVIGSETRVKVVKNKVAPPFKEAVFDILYGEGISRESEIIDLGSKNGLIDKAGAWYSYNGERIGQGKDNVRNYLREHTEMAVAIEKQIREKLLTMPVRDPNAVAVEEIEEDLDDSELNE